jgi:GNAT superfamily N-acetyltransferase
MVMDCVPFAPELLPDLTALINSRIAQIPPGWTLSQAQVAATLASVSELWHVHYPEENTWSESETVCVFDQEHLAAAAQWGCPIEGGRLGPVDQSTTGVLFWIIAEPDADTALRSLLEALAVRYLNAGCDRIATTRFAFGVGWLGIAVTWSRLIQGLQMAGFTVDKRWMVLTGAVDTPGVAPLSCPSLTHVEWQIDTTALEWELKLRAGSELIGECYAWSIPRHLAECAGSANWVTIEWLGVEPLHRRRGIGRWLLSEQLRRQAERGVTHAILWTELENRAARRLSESLGFQSSFECWEFVKTIE